MTHLVYAVFLYLFSMFCNSLMDAIGFHKAGMPEGKDRTLYHGWHIIKWLLFVPSLIAVGIFITLFFQEAGLGGWQWGTIAGMILVGWLLWELNYKYWRDLFKHKGLPDWM